MSSSLIAALMEDEKSGPASDDPRVVDAVVEAVTADTALVARLLAVLEPHLPPPTVYATAQPK